MTTPQFESSLIGPGGVYKASSTAEAASTTHSAHSDQANHAAVRWLIPPPPRSRSFVPSVTTPLYSSTVSQSLRQTLRGGVPKEYPPAPVTHEDMVIGHRRW